MALILTDCVANLVIFLLIIHQTVETSNYTYSWQFKAFKELGVFVVLI